MNHSQNTKSGPEPAAPAQAALPAPAPRKRVNLALQGGGSHGAFTWGVLDALLEDGRLDINGISGASAGAVNTVAVAHGLALAQRDGGDGYALARDKLSSIWHGVMAAGTLNSLNENLASMLPYYSLLPNPMRIASTVLRQWTSPYNLNPLDLNPLRSMLKREIDFDAIAALKGHPLFISATHVNSGKAEIFTGKEVTLQAVMASACLPQIFQAVEIHGKAYWDGGYVANPPLTPLISLCDTPDILLVQINPLVREGVPTTQSEISDRINEIGFNSNLLSQMQVIGLINRLIEEGKLHEPDFKQVRMHRIDGGDMLKDMSAASRVSTDAGMIEQLFEHGRRQAKRWLSRNFAAVGERSSVNLRKDYADDMVINA